MGTSIAYHLARAGVRDVVLVERDEPASGWLRELPLEGREFTLCVEN